MPVVAVTRFRLRALRLLPHFMLHAQRTIAQLRTAEGFLAGAVARDAGLVFWTRTLWRSEAAIQAYAASGAHRAAMPRLAGWSDEACVVHWWQGAAEPPGWSAAAERLRADGRATPVHRPGPNHASRSFAEPRIRDILPVT